LQTLTGSRTRKWFRFHFRWNSNPRRVLEKAELLPLSGLARKFVGGHAARGWAGSWLGSGLLVVQPCQQFGQVGGGEFPLERLCGLGVSVRERGQAVGDGVDIGEVVG